MTQYFSNYIWKNGLPYGIQPGAGEEINRRIFYKIASDPYHKRVSLEKYTFGNFTGIIYDSALFDFRHLKQGEQLAWQKTPISETENTALCHIRNQDDRLILIEEYLFEKGLCRECKAFSPIGPLLSVQKISYKAFNDPFNGVTLFDSNNHAVMSKHYEFNEETRQFSLLLKEDWGLTLD